MRYNLSKIMKRAHILRKENKNALMSECLIVAWAEAKASVEEVKELEVLPELIGTEKQVKWAEEIRKTVYKMSIEEVYGKNTLKRMNRWQNKKNELLITETSAVFWINNRNTDPASVIFRYKQR